TTCSQYCRGGHWDRDSDHCHRQSISCSFLGRDTLEGMESEHKLCGGHRIRDVAYMAKPRGALDVGSPHSLVRGEVHPRNWERFVAVSVFWGSVRRWCSPNRVHQLVCVHRTFYSQRLLFA